VACFSCRYRELVQPYNFSRENSRVTFLTPTGQQVQKMLDSDGYVPIELEAPTGTKTTIRRLLLYTEDCPRFGTHDASQSFILSRILLDVCCVGMYGRGIKCRACPMGVHIKLHLHSFMYACECISGVLSWRLQVMASTRVCKCACLCRSCAHSLLIQLLERERAQPNCRCLQSKI
jgi:hypothetical protein